MGNAPVPKFSVAEREETLRSPGSTVEYTSPTPDGHTATLRRRIRRDPSNPQRILKTTEDEGDNTKRCGFTWEDAEVKCGAPCPKGDPSECWPHWPKVANESQFHDMDYTCFSDLTSCDKEKPMGDCSAIDASGLFSDAWCQQRCGDPNGWCDLDLCICTEDDIVVDTEIDKHPKAKKLAKERTPELIKAVVEEGLAKLGLPECPWTANASGAVCTNVSQYECVEGAADGTCSGENWYGRSDCTSSCVHVSVLNFAPYYPAWRSGPLQVAGRDDQLPHYEHDDKQDQLQFVRTIAKGDIIMNPFCKTKENKFVGITLYSPKYKDKATRLVDSCERVGVCCKATVLPSDVFGPAAPEGSEEFRFRAISIKPAFILSQLKATLLPVVYLDSDLEFHNFPVLFQPGSWPKGDRDVLMFNYWANETNQTIRETPNTASGVVYFNQTFSAQKLLVAWAEAMAYSKNAKAPDDQVLDLLLLDGWLSRASFGWLPSAYLRTMPAYYRGVNAVIDHDHGNPPGLIAHSSDKPVLPPVAGYEEVLGTTSDVDCLATADLVDDDYCQNVCNVKPVPVCPQDQCVCNWDGTWPTIGGDKTDWSKTKSLGVPDAKSPG